MNNGSFKEEVCSKCGNFMTIPACMKCRVYTGDPYAPDFCCEGKEVTKNWKTMKYAEEVMSDWVVRDKEPL